MTADAERRRPRRARRRRRPRVRAAARDVPDGHAAARRRCSTGGCWPPPRSTCSAAGRRRGRGCGSPTGGSSRCRSTAGSAPARRGRRARCSAVVEAPVLDLGCGPGRHLAALRAAGKRGARRRPLPRRRAARARPRRRRDPRSTCSARCPAPARWRTALLLDGNIGIGGAPRAAAAARRASCWRPAASRSSSSTRRARRRCRTRCGSRRPAWCASGSAWARVGVDGIGRSREPPGSRTRTRSTAGGRWFAVLRRP